MPAHPVAELTEALLRLTGLEFETFVFELVRSIPAATEVQRNIRVGGLEIDVQANLDGQRVIFEAKRLANLPAERIQAIAIFATHARAATGAGRAIVVAPARISSSAKQVFQLNGVEFWGTNEIAERMDEGLWRRLQSSEPDLSPEEVPRKKAEAISDALANIAPGNADALVFQKLWLDAAEFLFSPPLGIPFYEVNDADKRNRRDIIIENFAESGFWAVARSEYIARYVIIDAKNYEQPVGKRCVLDVAHYLKRYGCGLFALLATRVGAKSSATHAIREHWIADNKMILVLDDTELNRMLEMRADGADPSAVIREKLRKFVFSL